MGCWAVRVWLGYGGGYVGGVIGIFELHQGIFRHKFCVLCCTIFYYASGKILHIID